MPPRVRPALRIEGSRTCEKVTVRKESMQSRWDFTLRRRLDQCLSAGDSRDRATEMASPECVKAYDAGVEEGLHGPFSPRLCMLSLFLLHKHRSTRRSVAPSRRCGSREGCRRHLRRAKHAAIETPAQVGREIRAPSGAWRAPWVRRRAMGAFRARIYGAVLCPARDG